MDLAILVAAEVKGVVDPAEPIEDRLRKAMKKSRGHWMATKEDDQFRGAVAAVYETATEDERARIKKSLDGLRALSAATSGVPVDFSALAVDDGIEVLPLPRLWNESKD